MFKKTNKNVNKTEKCADNSMKMNINSNGSSFMFDAEMYCEFNIQSIHSMIYLTKWWNENQPRTFVYFFPR